MCIFVPLNKNTFFFRQERKSTFSQVCLFLVETNLISTKHTTKKNVHANILKQLLTLSGNLFQDSVESLW